MTTYSSGSVIRHIDALWLAKGDASGIPGVDPTWELLVRGVPWPDTDGQILVTDNGTYVLADPSTIGGGGGGGTGGTYSLTDAWKGAYHGPSGGHGILYEPTASEGFELGSLPAWITHTGLVLAGYPTGDWGSGGEGADCVLVYTGGSGAVSSMSFDVQSTGDTQVDILSAWGLPADGTGTITVDGTPVASHTGADANSVYEHHVFTLSAGTHTVAITATDGGSGEQNVVAVDTISLTGTTPDGLGAGYNTAATGGGGTAYTAGDLVTYQGDLYLALQNVQNIAPSSGAPYWARLSTHGGTGGGSTLPDPGADGNLLTAQSSTWISAPPAGDDAPDLTLIFENGLI